MSAPASVPRTFDRSAGVRPRVDSVDLVRGLVMVIMALDHTRDFTGNMQINPMDMDRTHPALFWTRWITHFCAPTFVFLAGASAFLFGSRGRSGAEVSRFLLTRGLWLVFLEFTLVRFGWAFNFDYRWSWGQVIWAIGWALVLLSFLVKLRPDVIGWIGVATIALHNLTDGIGRAEFGDYYWLWAVLHVLDFLHPTEGSVFVTGYPLIPWFGVALAGYGFGQVLLKQPSERRSWMLRAGVLLTAGFVVLRFSNLYGDPQPWRVQADAAHTFFSFLNTTKYGPSLLYTMMTLGPMLIFLGLLQGRTVPRWAEWLVVFGRVPMFYYLVHLPLIHVLALAIAYARYDNVGFIFGNPPFFFGGKVPPDWGLSLPLVYAAWALVIVALYPLCRWFARLKQRSSAVWLSYF